MELLHYLRVWGFLRHPPGDEGAELGQELRVRLGQVCSDPSFQYHMVQAPHLTHTRRVLGDYPSSLLYDLIEAWDAHDRVLQFNAELAEELIIITDIIRVYAEDGAV